jgi:hypothetical protein
MWDIHFKFNASDSLPAGISRRTYGIHWTGSEFWASPWAVDFGGVPDSIYRYDRTGKYLGSIKIVGTTALRGYTAAKGDIWACNAKDSIYKIALNGQVVKKVKLPTGITARFLTWDGSGFWVGNFSTNLWKVDSNGVLVQTIPFATHGVGGIAGAVYDSLSANGPFLWVNAQTSLVPSTTNGAYIRPILMRNGIGLPIERDMKLDGILTNISSAMTLVKFPDKAKPTLVAGVQLVTGLGATYIGYELDFTLPNFVECGIDSIGIDKGYTIYPKVFNSVINYNVKLTNRGTLATPANAAFIGFINRGTQTVASPSVPINVPSFSSRVFNIGRFGDLNTGDYNAFFLNDTPNDLLIANDSSRQFFSVADSTMGRDLTDFGVTTSRLGPGGNQTVTPRRIGTLYSFPATVTINSVTMQYRSANVNDSLYVAIFRVRNGVPTDSIGGTTIHVTTSQDTQAVLSNGFRRTFRLRAPVTVNKGDSIVIASTDAGRGAHFVVTTGNPQPINTVWAYRQQYTSGTDTIRTGWYSDTSTRAIVTRRGYTIRPNLNIRTDVSDPTGNITDMEIMPNPTTGDLRVRITLADDDKISLEILDLAGKSVYTEGGVWAKNTERYLPLHHLSNGLYFLRVRSKSGGMMVQKLIKQ